METTIEKFDPTVADLSAMVAETQTVFITDFEDKNQIEVVRKFRISLRDARICVEKRGKELRADALTFQKAVIAKEKELIQIIEPEIMRLEALEDAAKSHALKQERLRKLPERKDRLFVEVQLDTQASDEAMILEMTDVDFEAFVERKKAEIVACSLAVQKMEQLAREAELNARQAEIDVKEQALESERKAKQQEDVRLSNLEAARAEGEREAKAQQEKKESEAKNRIAQEEVDRKAAAIKLEKTAKYKAFLAFHGFTVATRDDFKVEETASGYILYKRLGEFLK